jgi:superfamily II DNA/RNA helicase
MDHLSTALTVPDLWQQKAVNLLRAKHDVVVHAPTGAGKTFIFESLVKDAFPGKAVFTVPTRALANDKFCEWTDQGWNVGITTGDVSYNINAPIIVATLETQKRALIAGRGPKLLVIDEYQMLSDSARGVNYEIAIAMAPADTQLLLLSGSVANFEEITRWLQRCGRNAVSINHTERPVRLDEVHLDALPDQISKTIHGRWPRYVARALAAEMGPLLIFAPRRKVAENLARSLAAALPELDPIILTTEQQAIAGTQLTRCLKNRVAFHHSGMSYAQRAGLVEPLAKNSQLKVIVATTGLAAGINFSMRSVLVLEREYRVAEAHRMLRPDELLQMFGRAGRRGLDERGTVLYTDGKPRLGEARPLRLTRETIVDWPSLIGVIQAAVESEQSPLTATRDLTQRLFSVTPIRLGLDDFLAHRKSAPETHTDLPDEQKIAGGTVAEFKNSEGVWERRRAPQLFQLKDTWFLKGDTWYPGLSSPKIVASLRIGTICKFGSGKDRRYGLEAPLATFPKDTKENRLMLSKWLVKVLREQARADRQKPNIPKLWTLAKIEKVLLPQMPQLARGGRSLGLTERGSTLLVQLDYGDAQIHAYKDLTAKGLLNPVERKRHIAGSDIAPLDATSAAPQSNPRSVAEQWHALGLIDEAARPTRRGILFSFFNHGEGLAVAAALEDPTYGIEELLYDLANIRAGHRFQALALAGRPLAALCQERYGLRTIPGYLRRGLPEDYGDGASEILYNIEHKSSRAEAYLDDDLSRGDIERARVEWRSLMAHIATAQPYDWDRWTELQSACVNYLAKHSIGLPFENLPPLTRQQRKR